MTLNKRYKNKNYENTNSKTIHSQNHKYRYNYLYFIYIYIVSYLFIHADTCYERIVFVLKRHKSCQGCSGERHCSGVLARR